MKRDKNEYQAKYIYLTKSIIPDNFDIHHIDGNRNNNLIDNLVCLPVKLHSDYHKYFMNGDFEKLEQTELNITYWVIFRNYLLGKLHYFIDGFSYENNNLNPAG